MTTTHRTYCKICSQPMSLEIADESLTLVQLDKLLKMAVCDGCMIGQRRIKQPPRTASLPYKD